MLVYRYREGLLITAPSGDSFVQVSDVTIDDLFVGRVAADDLRERAATERAEPLDSLPEDAFLPPIGSQEVWAAGVTYQRSRTARMKESSAGGGSSFYDKVYNAERPELFFKATPHRVVGHRQAMLLRGDSSWSVPEPELTLALGRDGRLLGYTIGNDLSSRDIEGENPLYLPQAKVWDRSAALGPALFLAEEWPAPSTEIGLSIHREGRELFSSQTTLSQMKQTLPNLVEHLFRHNSFPNGCFLMTGTGIIPEDDFSLAPGDEVAIKIDPVGTLVNVME